MEYAAPKYFACGARLRIDSQKAVGYDNVGVIGMEILFCHYLTWATQYKTTVYDDDVFKGDWSEWAVCDEGHYMIGA